MGNFDKLPCRFGRVDGDFKCGGVGLTTLKGCPVWVGGSFFCENNCITNLKNSPLHVGDWLKVSGNYFLTSLEGITQTIPGSFFADNCVRLASIAHAPVSIGGNCILSNCGINSRNGTGLSLSGLTTKIGGELRVSWGFRAALLQGFFTGAQYINVTKNIIGYNIVHQKMFETFCSIFKKYEENPKPNMVMPCAAELIKAGLADNARI